MHICWDTPSNNTGLWQLPEVSSAFKVVLILKLLDELDELVFESVWNRLLWNAYD